jgi:hypothetical protein
MMAGGAGSVDLELLRAVAVDCGADILLGVQILLEAGGTHLVISRHLLQLKQSFVR